MCVCRCRGVSGDLTPVTTVTAGTGQRELETHESQQLMEVRRSFEAEDEDFDVFVLS